MATTIKFDTQNSRVAKNSAGVEKAFIVFSVVERPELGKLSISMDSLVPGGPELKTAIGAKLAKIDESLAKNTALTTQLIAKDNLVL